LTTRVINIKSKESYDVYIGNQVRFHPQKYPQSIWGNPYKVKRYGREKAIQLYREKLLASPLLLSQLHQLRDKTLGCWCKPDKCHGDVLVELVDKMNITSI
jgi:Schitoviridae RNA polymerase